MSLSIPSDEVKAVMEMLRVQQEEAKLRAVEGQRIREEEIRKYKEAEAKKAHQLLIEAEAQVRLDIENCDKVAFIKEIKNKIKQRPDMHIIDLFNLDKSHEIRKEFAYQCIKEAQEEIASENEILRLEALDKLREDIAKANKALPSNKINGGEFEEGRLQIEYIISLDNPNPGVDTRSSGLYFETRHLRAWDNEQLQNRANPQLKEIPVTWNNDYKDNKIPFLPQCPVCSKQNTILFKWGGGEYGSPRVYTRTIDTIEGCHYKWDSNTNKHYNCSKEWDPSDPDGSKVLTEKRKKEIEEIQQQISELQVRLTELNKLI